MKALIAINLIVQLALLVALLVAAFLAKRGLFIKHCNIIRIAVPVQLLSIFVIMLPEMLGYINNLSPTAFLNIEIWVHHFLGLVVVAIWVYVNLVVMGKIKVKGRLRNYMRLAFGVWFLALISGIHIYVQIWGWPWQA
jgi:putative membrane protein